MGQSDDKNQPADSIDADAPQPIQNKDKLFCMLDTTSQCVQGRLQQQNIINFRFGPTSYAAHLIQQNSLVSYFKIIFNEPMLRHIRKCSITKAQPVTGNDKWFGSLDELDKFIGLRCYWWSYLAYKKYVECYLGVQFVQQNYATQ